MWLPYRGVGGVLFAHRTIAHVILNAFQMQEATEYLSSSRNLKRSESLILTIVQVVELYTSRNINAIKNLYILEILFIGQTIFILV